MFSEPRVALIAGFLREIGIPVERGEVTAGFLPGILLEGGALVVDEARLAYPGDLLHEGGHVAVAAPHLRAELSGSVDLPGTDMTELEHAAIAWSYAAALALRVDPAEVFHAGGYHGHSTGLLMTYGVGVYPGANPLETAGMTATGARAAELGVQPYPHMLRWLRPG